MKPGDLVEPDAIGSSPAYAKPLLSNQKTIHTMRANDFGLVVATTTEIDKENNEIRPWVLVVFNKTCSIGWMSEGWLELVRIT